MNNIRINIIGLNGAIEVFDNIPTITINKIKRQIVKSALKIETDAKRKAPSDTGRLKGISIQTKISLGGFSADVFSDANYAMAVEKGSRPHFPPVTALEGWARRHGMEDMEFLIARAIAKKGTKPQPFLFPAWEAERPEFINEIKNILRSLERGI